MEKTCKNCRWESADWTSTTCYGCRPHIEARSNWKPKVLENMDIPSWYPKSEVLNYLANDVKTTHELYFAGGRSNGKTLYTLDAAAKKIGCRVVAESWFKSVNMPGIEKVIFNDPATIVIWDDGTKTIVKTQGDDIFDPEKGLAMAVSKKALGNKGNYFDEFKKWLPEETAPKTKPCKDFECFTTLSQAARKFNESMAVEEENWKQKLDEYIESLKKK